MNNKKIIKIIAIIIGTLIVLGTLWYFYSTKTEDQTPATFMLTSTSFEKNGPMPMKFAYSDCGGQNISPQLTWSHAPAGTKSFALIVDDPDAPEKPWIHWIMFNIPADVTSLEEGGTFSYPQLANDYGLENKNYDGPCPPSGIHRYFFKLYALKNDIPLMHTHSAQRLKNYLETNPDKNVLGKAVLMGTYSSRRK